MSLATRCTHCGTVFRVVQDQLKISEGWVRCGRCNDVFNALEGLFDLEREAPPEWQGQPGRGGPDIPLPAAGDLPLEPPPDPFLVERMDEQIFGRKRPGDAADAPRRPPTRQSRVELPLRGADIALEPPDPREPMRYDPELRADPRDMPDIDLARIETLDDEPPGFVRQAMHEERWRRSPQRWMLGGLGLLLALALAAQGVLHFRDYVAARWPATAPTLSSWCAALGCTIEPLRRIESITVDASALTKVGSGDTFRLTLTLHNRGNLPLAMPAVDLSLTDGSGLLVARKALEPKDFRVARPVLAPQSEQTLQLVLGAGNPRVAGYTVEIFYP